MRFSKLIAALLIASILPAANAASLGSIGPTYPIGEESALDMSAEKTPPIMTIAYRRAIPEDTPACLVLRGMTRENAFSVERFSEDSNSS